MTTEHRFTDYEVVSIAAKQRVLITINRNELPLNGSEQAVRTTLKDNELSVEFDSGHTLRFADVPAQEHNHLASFEPLLCALEGKGVAFALSFPHPTAPRLVSKPR